jgi:hypothetical protein
MKLRRVETTNPKDGTVQYGSVVAKREKAQEAYVVWDDVPQVDNWYPESALTFTEDEDV